MYAHSLVPPAILNENKCICEVSFGGLVGVREACCHELAVDRSCVESWLECFAWSKHGDFVDLLVLAACRTTDTSSEKWRIL